MAATDPAPPLLDTPIICRGSTLPDACMCAFRASTVRALGVLGTPGSLQALCLVDDDCVKCSGMALYATGAAAMGHVLFLLVSCSVAGLCVDRTRGADARADPGVLSTAVGVWPEWMRDMMARNCWTLSLTAFSVVPVLLSGVVDDVAAGTLQAADNITGAAVVLTSD